VVTDEPGASCLAVASFQVVAECLVHAHEGRRAGARNVTSLQKKPGKPFNFKNLHIHF